MSDRAITTLVDQIRETIKARSEGSQPVAKTREAYKKLLRQYNVIEQRYISGHTGGFVKGILYHHNNHNNANLTAIFSMQGGIAQPMIFAGDTVVLKAVPELINNEFAALGEEGTTRIRIGEKSGQTFSLILKMIKVAREPIVIASVTSSTLFNTGDFEYLGALIKSLYEKNAESRSPVMMIYINNIAAEISNIYKSNASVELHIDQFQLRIPRGSFRHAGIFTLIEFSNFIVSILKSKYPESARIFALSLTNYLVVYDDITKSSLDFKRHRINFEFHGNSIPYKVDQVVINSPQSMYLFLEKL
jgi:hypothetical protein